MNRLPKVRDYFDRAARRFDAIYKADKPITQRLGDALFRRVVLERFKLICALAPIPGDWSVLDVGCGSGRYSIALAHAGAQVRGIDVSQAMIALAQQEAEREGIAGRCTFEVSGFLESLGDTRADVVVATGYFDYLEDPLPHLRKMAALCKGRIFATFPKRFEIRTPIRKVRFMMARGFVRFYSRREVLCLFDETRITQVALVDLGRDYVAVARVSS
jgi:2-polyprenyl-3-methyl-5-hydroxy-6-metoxy-1,4-benzoquinol methylase